MPESIDERLHRLEARLARLESLLAALPMPSAGEGGDASDSTAIAADRLEDVSQADRGFTSPFSASVTAGGAWVPPIPKAPDPDTVGTIPADDMAAPVISYQQPPPLPQIAPPGDLERTIGLKWAGWFGAIVLVIGAALAIKFAYDQGWFGNLPDLAKLMLMSLGGFALLFSGEVVLRRVSKLSAVGLFGAGVSVLFLVGYAGYEWYDVYAQGTALALMGAATLIGILVAARADLVSIAVLSLIGGHVVPLLLGASTDSSVPLLCFLLLLQILALALCWWQATPKWWVLRSVSLFAILLWQMALVTGGSTAPADTVPALTVFAAVYWVLYQLELSLTTVRVEQQSATDTKHATDRPAGLIFSVLVTAQAMLVLLMAHDAATPVLRGGLVIAAATACLIAGVVLWRSRRSGLVALSASLRAQAAALLVLAVPVALDGQNIVFGWLVLALCFGMLAILRRLRISSIAAIATWLLAVYALGSWAFNSTAAQAIWLTIGDVAISAAVVVSGIATLVGHVVAVLFGIGFNGDKPRVPATSDTAVDGLSADDVAMLIHALAGVLWSLAAIKGLPVLPATLALVLYAWLLCGASFAPVSRKLAFISAAAILTATVKWAVVDLLQERLSAATVAAPVLNAYLFSGLLIAGSMIVVAWSRRSILLSAAAGSEESLRLFRSVLLLLVVTILTIALTAEISAMINVAGQGRFAGIRTRQLAYTMLWTTAAAIVLLLDRSLFKPQETVVGRIAAVAIVLVACKYNLFDAQAATALASAGSTLILVNMQTLAGIVACGGLIAVASLWPHRPLRLAAQVLAAFTVLMIGSVEIDRFANLQTAAPVWIVRQAGWSIWWSVFAVALVLGGFAVRAAVLRVLGLALFGLTLLKVVLVDLSGVGSGWRVLSFFGLGLLLLGTSVLYGRFGSRLLNDASAPTTD